MNLLYKDIESLRRHAASTKKKDMYFMFTQQRKKPTSIVHLPSKGYLR